MTTQRERRRVQSIQPSLKRAESAGTRRGTASCTTVPSQRDNTHQPGQVTNNKRRKKIGKGIAPCAAADHKPRSLTSRETFRPQKNNERLQIFTTQLFLRLKNKTHGIIPNPVSSGVKTV